MRVFSFIPVACILMHDLSTSCVCFYFVQQVARYEGMDSPHVRIFIYHCSVHLDARPIPLMSVFSFVQQVARYKATYPSHERIFIRATSCTLRGDLSPHASVFIRATRYMKCGEWCFDIVYLW